MSTTSKNDRIEGVMCGQAVADALGMGYEFRATIPAEEEAVMRDGVLFPAYHWTDDTEQAIVVALARTIAENVAEGMLSWLRTGPRDVGRQTATVLGGAWNAKEVIRRSREYGNFKAGQAPRPGQQPGLANGSLMRTGPVALFWLGEPVKIARVAREVSDVTHYDPTGYTGDACVIWSLIINAAVEGDGFTLFSAAEAAISLIPEDRRKFWAEVISEALYGNLPAGKNGSAVAAFKVALYAVAHSEDYSGAIQLAIHAGHDTDTTAAITGMLAGAIYGRHGIPAGWRANVQGKAGPYPGRMTEQDIADLARCTANGWDFEVPEYAREWPEQDPRGITLQDYVDERPA